MQMELDLVALAQSAMNLPAVGFVEARPVPGLKPHRRKNVRQQANGRLNLVRQVQQPLSGLKQVALVGMGPSEAQFVIERKNECDVLHSCRAACGPWQCLRLS